MPRSRTPYKTETGTGRAATVKDIAEVAGVSATTVSNVLLSKSGNFSEKTADRIRKLAKEMGYRRNNLARSLVTRRSFTLGLLLEESFNISHPENQYFVSFLQVFLGHAAALKQQVKLIHQSDLSGDSAIPEIDDGSIDGLVGLVLSPENKLINWMAETSYMSSVLVGGESEEKRVSSLDIDDGDSMAEVAEHLVDLGHRRIWFITGKGRHPSLTARRKGFSAHLEKSGISLDGGSVFRADIEGRDAREIISLYQASPASKRPTAIVCVNDLIALGVLRAAEDEGLKIPEDFSLTGFDGFPQGDWSRPRLTTVRQPFNLFGRRAAEILVAGAEGNREIVHEVYSGELMIKDSSAAV